VALKLHTSASFRAVAKSSEILSRYQEGPLQTATHTTILLWVKKIGYYLLTKPKEHAEDWMIIPDHSIQLGPDTLFVIFGIRESQIDFGRPLRYQDLEPLRVVAKSHWTGEGIRDCVGELQKELGQITYAVGDWGSDLKKGLRLAEIIHSHDVTHHIALFLKKLYSSNAEYQAVTQHLSRMRRQLCHTRAAHIIPPKQRTKSRYHHLKPLSEYGRHILHSLDQHPDEAGKDDPLQKHISWLRAHRTFFEELIEVHTLLCQIERHVKHQGVSPVTIGACCTLLAQASTSKGRLFKEYILHYFQTVLALNTAFETILCTSDILESAFGKYKNYVSDNPMAGITDLALCLAAFTCSLEQHEIQEALEQSTIADLKEWSLTHIGTTLLKKRRDVFSQE